MSLDFSKYSNVHVIGIGGIGISAIARMLMLQGKRVSGSDRAPSEVTHELERLGVSIHYNQKAENIKDDVDLVIYTIAIPNDNPELMEARNRSIKCVSYPEALGALSEQKYTIAVAGTHGKTTTTAMAAKVLIDAGLDPTVIVGSFLKDQQSNFVAGKGEYLVAEACEYRRSFLNLSPKIVIITNIDDDHLDYYKDMSDITSAFIELVQKIPKDGFLICNKELPHIAEVAEKAQCTVVDYELFGDQNLELKVPGEHNLSNAAAVLALADLLGVSRKKAEDSLKAFSGTWRRFDFKGTDKNGAKIYDDYGHHPTEVKATLRGARELFPDKRIIVAFQPHLFSRTKQHLKEFGKAFVDADMVVVAPIYPAREIFDPSIRSDMVALEIVRNGGMALAPATTEDVEMDLKKELSSDHDVLITMGAGDIYTIGEKFVDKKPL